MLRNKMKVRRTLFFNLNIFQASGFHFRISIIVSSFRGGNENPAEKGNKLLVTRPTNGEYFFYINFFRIMKLFLKIEFPSLNVYSKPHTVK